MAIFSLTVIVIYVSLWDNKACVYIRSSIKTSPDSHLIVSLMTAQQQLSEACRTHRRSTEILLLRGHRLGSEIIDMYSKSTHTHTKKLKQTHSLTYIHVQTEPLHKVLE